MSVPYIRKASKAGTWYTEDPKKLNTELTTWLSRAEEDYKEPAYKSQSHQVKAIIMPHAGYHYSGPTAAYSAFIIRHLKGLRKVFILGPSHRYYFRKLGVFDAVGCDTPLGELKVATDVVHRLTKSPLVQKLSRGVDEQEHSIEMMLPYVRSVLGDKKDVTVIPILVGSLSDDNIPKCAELLFPYFDQPGSFFIISSDFCHWGRSYEYSKSDGITPISAFVKKLDFEGLHWISEFNGKEFARYLSRTGNTICGRYPIQLLLALCEDLKKIKKHGLSCEQTRYAQSSSIATCKPRAKDSLVAYVAAIIRIHQM